MHTIELKDKEGKVRELARVSTIDSEWTALHTWYLSSHGYVTRNAKKPEGGYIPTRLHHEILVRMGYTGFDRPEFIDGNRLNCCRDNLRPKPKGKKTRIEEDNPPEVKLTAPTNELNYLTQADIAERWGLRLQAVQNRKDRHVDFPKPIGFVSRGKVPIYREEDVARYEASRVFKVGGRAE